jgi:hypothetical protein
MAAEILRCSNQDELRHGRLPHLKCDELFLDECGRRGRLACFIAMAEQLVAK